MSEQETGTAPPPSAPRQPSSWGSRLLIGVLVALGLSALVVAGVQEAKDARLLAPGEAAPGLKAERYGGGEVDLAKLKGQVVMVDFWATWCPPCVEELPTLVKLAGEYRDRGLVFVAANHIESDSKEDVAAFVHRLPPLPPNVHVAFVDSATLDRFNVHNLPTLFFVDRDGKVGQGNVGFASEAVLRQRIEQALAR